MKIKILIDNLVNGNYKNLCSEWGLSVYIEYGSHKILLDTGASEQFARNAAGLGVDLSQIDAGVLSHAHYDHANGLDAFFRENRDAPFFLQKGAAENCYHTHRLLKFFTYQKYIGIKKGCLKRHGQRILFVDGTAEIFPGVFLTGHNDCVLSRENHSAIARAVGLSIKENGKYRPDSFDHEQSLIFETPQGLFVMNSCCHGGADNIIKEVELGFSGQKIFALLGGFHLYRYSDDQVRNFAFRLKELDVQKIYTGHCTGEKAYGILKGILGERVQQMFTGMSIEVEGP